jgi:hypothetical protein
MVDIGLQHERLIVSDYCCTTDSALTPPVSGTGSIRPRHSVASRHASTTLTAPSANAPAAPCAAINDPPSVEPAAMPAIVAPRCQVNASVAVPAGASAPTSENWQAL